MRVSKRQNVVDSGHWVDINVQDEQFPVPEHMEHLLDGGMLEILSRATVQQSGHGDVLLSFIQELGFLWD